MSNREIVSTECMLKGIKEEVYTYAEWRKRGYQVKRGQRACITTQLWKQVKYKDKSTEEEKTKMVMTKASLFSRSQVEIIYGMV